MTVHKFTDSGDAYDFCQTSDGVRDGDTLLIEREPWVDPGPGEFRHDDPGEHVVGLAWTWPVAVTVEHGELHSVTEGCNVASLAGDAEWTDEQITAAVDLAIQRGFAVRPEFTGWASLGPDPLGDWHGRNE
jgi:hypothetical protein